MNLWPFESLKRPILSSKTIVFLFALKNCPKLVLHLFKAITSPWSYRKPPPILNIHSILLYSLTLLNFQEKPSIKNEKCSFKKKVKELRFDKNKDIFTCQMWETDIINFRFYTNFLSAKYIFLIFCFSWCFSLEFFSQAGK